MIALSQRSNKKNSLFKQYVKNSKTAKKETKQVIQNYCPVPLLLISSKILERLIFNSFYKFVEENSLFCSSQSEFRKTNSCVNQLLSTVH